MSNKQVGETWCTEPNDNTLDALQFATAFEDGLKRQRTIGKLGTSVSVKEEPVFAVTQKANNKECCRCGAGNFAAAHRINCKGRDTICN